MVSIAIPAYKPEFIESAIISILEQRYTNYELIIVDDNSPFNLSSIINKFKDDKIRYYKNESNVGKDSLVRNWNKCLEYAKGEYFVLFSDDDVMDKQFLSELIHLAEIYPKVNIFHSRVKKINNDGSTIEYTPLSPEYENIVEFVWHTISGHRNIFATEFLIRTKALRKIGGFVDFPLAWGSDYATWFSLAQSNGIVYTSNPLCSWRLSDSNITSIGNRKKRLLAINQYELWLTNFINNIKPVDEKDKILIIQAKSNLKRFFRKKREFLFEQEIREKSKMNSIFQFKNSISMFNLTYKSAIYQLAKKIFDNN